MPKNSNYLLPHPITHDRLLQDCFLWAWNAHPSTHGHLWHIPNELKPYPGESKAAFVRRLAYQKAIGVVPGVLDFGLACGGRYYELDGKLPGDRVSDAQKVRVKILQKNGGNGYFFSNLAEFQLIFEKILANGVI